MSSLTFHDVFYDEGQEHILYIVTGRESDGVHYVSSNGIPHVHLFGDDSIVQCIGKGRLTIEAKE